MSRIVLVSLVALSGLSACARHSNVPEAVMQRSGITTAPISAAEFN
jgi:hypothetical protein